jgi:signal transduction histidine kinase/ligand-binding sensor domain-containing protein/DNA-binding response OmpR family regulator
MAQSSYALMKNSIFLLGLLFSFSLAAKNYDMMNLTNNDGLSNSSVNTIYQDSDGLLWLGTWDGLNAYNSRDFKVNKPDPGNIQTISNNIIREIVEEQRNILWIATDRGINRLDKRKNIFTRFFTEANNQRIFSEHSFLMAKNSSNKIFAVVYDQGLYYFDVINNQFITLNAVKNLRIKKIFFDLDDNMWLLTEEKTLFKLVFQKGNARDPQIKRVVEFQHLKNIETVFYNANNELWMQATDDQVYSYQISEGILTNYPTGIKKTGRIKAIVFKDTYQLWGTAEGLFQFDPITRKLEKVLPNISVLSLFAGTQQIIWVGTDMHGVWQLSPSREKVRSYSASTVPSFSQSAVRTFFEASNNQLWVGTKGNGIYTFSQKNNYPETTYTKHYTTQDGLLSNAIFTIVKGQDKEYWIGTDGRGINYYNTQTNKIQSLSVDNQQLRKVNLSSVYSILPANKNTLWVGTSGYGMYQLTIDRNTRPYSIKAFKQYLYEKDQPSSLSNNIVYSIIQDDATHLWIATRGGGLNRFNIQTGQFQSFRFSTNNGGFISSDDILCLYKDQKGFLWAGTSMGLNKLLRFKNGKPVFMRFTEKEGMPNNTIHGILEDKDHTIWLSTNKGIANLVFERNTYRIIPYFKKDGLQNNEFSDGAFYESPSSNQLYFGGISGFNVFNPLEITHSSYMPTLLLDAFYIDNIETNISDYLQTKQADKTLDLAYKNKSFSFKFIPVDYVSGTKCEISYLLEGYQKDWIHLGTSNTLVFTNLPTGHYVLKVRCSNANKIWNTNFFTLPIIIHPPWWASPFAYLCYVLLILLILFGIRRMLKYQYSIRQNFKMKELEKQKIEEIHQAKLSFFTNIAHEFSNSLTLIYGPCEQLLRTHVADSVTRKYVNIIKSNSERMQNLIQQMIDFRKAETGHLRLEIERIEIPELVKFVIDNFIEQLEEKKIHFTLTFSPEVIFWQTDRDSIEKIVFNLLSNALKYTPAEECIEVQVEIKNALLFICVKNTGVGIKPAFQQQIFDRFEVLDRFERQISKGVETRNGIGLALCKSISEVLHGNIEVASDGETFTSFVVSIPEQALSKSVSSQKQQPSTAGHIEEKEIRTDFVSPIPDTQKNGLILVIDDDKEIRQLLQDFLCIKYEVAEAANGQEAIESMRIRMPMLIVCDIIMPAMDGVAFVKVMKSQEITRHIPIILLSSKSSIESQIEGLEVGADAYLSKPFHPRHLEALIDSLIDRNKAVLEYSASIYAALEQFEGKFIHKEDKDLMLHITNVIHDHLDNEALSLDFVASETAISKMQLYRKIKEITGQTPTEYIRTIRLKLAEKLLKTTNNTVQEIMFHCGFNNKAYFYREFAKKYHLTPKEYRSGK